MRYSLRWSILLSIGAALLVALVPAAVILDRRLTVELEEKARSDLALAPLLLADRNQARGDVLMMHAQELAGTRGLADALNAPDPAPMERVLEGAPAHPGEEPVLVDASGRVRMGNPMGAELADGTRDGSMPTGFVSREGSLHMISLAPVKSDGEWMGAAGVSAAIDDVTASALAGLTGSNVVILDGDGGVVGATGDSILAARLASLALGAWAEAAGAAAPTATGDPSAHAPGTPPTSTDSALEVDAPGVGRHWITVAPLGTAGSVVFALAAQRELAVLPALRRGALVAGGLALALALVTGTLLAATVARPVGSLAHAADRLARGDFQTPLPGSSVAEVDRMATAFEGMRTALAARLDELEAANRALEERQERLRSLQAEIVQQDRLASSGRLLAELAHEIRNPVANVRNCLEVLRRGLEDRPELREFSDLAIEELLRMHELAEQILEVNRPIDPDATHADARAVAENVARLFGARVREEGSQVRVTGETRAEASIAPEALKQVLTNLVQNALESMGPGAVVEIVVRGLDGRVDLEVRDRGPGISAEHLPKIFDPFFTTKESTRGTGLGLYLADAIVRRHGGSLTAANRSDGPGAVFRIELSTAPGHAGDSAP